MQSPIFPNDQSEPRTFKRLVRRRLRGWGEASHPSVGGHPCPCPFADPEAVAAVGQGPIDGARMAGANITGCRSAAIQSLAALRSTRLPRHSPRGIQCGNEFEGSPRPILGGPCLCQISPRSILGGLTFQPCGGLSQLQQDVVQGFPPEGLFFGTVEDIFCGDICGLGKGFHSRSVISERVEDFAS